MNYNYFLLSAALVAGVGTMEAGKRMQSPAVRNAAELSAPKALPATDVTEKGFTANWEPVDGAEAYCVYVYTKQEVASDGEYALIDEDFDGVDFGTPENPVWGDELYETLDSYTLLPNWSVYGLTTYAGGMVGGIVYSPYIDLRSNGGVYDVTVWVYATEGDEIRIESNGTGEKVIKTFVCEESGVTSGTVRFENGRQDTFFSIVNMTATETDPAYVDRVAVTQDLKAGDTIWTMVGLNESVEHPSTSVAFSSLPFAGGAKQLYYDLYASKVDYSAPTYQSIFSDFSEKIEVNLSGSSELNTIDAASAKAYGSYGCACVDLKEESRVRVCSVSGQLVADEVMEAGSHTLPLAAGLYIVSADGKTSKITVK